MGRPPTPESASEVAIVAGLAGWPCELAADTAEARERLTHAFARLRVPGASAARSRVTVRMAREPIYIRLVGPHGVLGLDELLACPEWRSRLCPAGDPSAREYQDRSFGGAPVVRAAADGYVVLRSDLWILYVLLGFLGLMLREHSIASLHAAVCACGDRSVVLLGPSGAGKSTLCWALHRQGAEYYGDELAFFTWPELRLSAWPRSLCLRPGGVHALASPPDVPAWYEARPDDPKVAVALPEPTRPCPEARVVLCFLDGFAPAPAIAPIGGGEAARRLLTGLALGDPAIGGRLEVCAALVSRYPCWRISVGPPDETAALIAARLDSSGTGA